MSITIYAEVTRDDCIIIESTFSRTYKKILLLLSLLDTNFYSGEIRTEKLASKIQNAKDALEPLGLQFVIPSTDGFTVEHLLAELDALQEVVEYARLQRSPRICWE